jgi:hypothetical protein
LVNPLANVIEVTGHPWQICISVRVYSQTPDKFAVVSQRILSNPLTNSSDEIGKFLQIQKDIFVRGLPMPLIRSADHPLELLEKDNSISSRDICQRVFLFTHKATPFCS